MAIVTVDRGVAGELLKRSCGSEEFKAAVVQYEKGIEGCASFANVTGCFARG